MQNHPSSNSRREELRVLAYSPGQQCREFDRLRLPPVTTDTRSLLVSPLIRTALAAPMGKRRTLRFLCHLNCSFTPSKGYFSFTHWLAGVDSGKPPGLVVKQARICLPILASMESPAIPDFLSEVNATWLERDSCFTMLPIFGPTRALPGVRPRSCDRPSGLLMLVDRCWQL